MRALLVAASLLLLPPAAIAAADFDLEAWVEERGLDALGVRVTWTPQGPIEEPVTGRAFLAAALRLLPSSTDAVTPVAAVGISDTHLPANGRSPCQLATMVILYFGVPGGAIVKADQAPLQIGVNPECPRHQTMAGVVMEGATVAVVYGPCITAQTFDLPRPLGTPSGVACGTNASAHGNGALTSVSFFGLSLDIFEGSGPNVVQTGIPAI